MKNVQGRVKERSRLRCVGNLRNAISGRPLIRAFFPLFSPDECIFRLMNALPRHFWPISGIIRHPDRANWHLQLSDIFEASQATHGMKSKASVTSWCLSLILGSEDGLR